MTEQQRGPERPNILVLMSDEHAPHFSGLYGHPIVQSPHLDALGRSGTVFDAGYCNSPLCVPSRASFVSGKQVSRIGAWDNGAPFPSETVTFAHLLRGAGYEVVLDGKMHFIGPDKLHGFERQLTRDAHGAGHVTGQEWRAAHPAGGPQVRRRLEEAGPGRAAHLDFDDEVEAAALDWLRQPARRDAPWCLVASFLCPHFPLVVPEPYFARYYPNNVDLPVLPPGHIEAQHPAHARVRRTFALDGVTEAQLRVARAAYYGLVTYLDDKIGRLLAALRESGQLERTVVVYTADHGELAGEHGLWWKNSFYEQSARVPLLFSWPGAIPSGVRYAGAVSNVDVARTLVDLGHAAAPEDWDGDSLLPLLRAPRGPRPGRASLGPPPVRAPEGVQQASDPGRGGNGAPSGEGAPWKDEAVCEYYGHATNRPQRMLRAGRWKYNYYHGEPAELYDLGADPGELRNLAGEPALAGLEGGLRRRVLADWDPDEVARRVRHSQRSRQTIARARAERAPREPEPQGLPAPPHQARPAAHGAV